MSNNFTRTKYDPEELEMYNATVKNRNDYVMNLTSVENSNLCYAHAGARNAISEVSRPLNAEGFLDFNAKTDIENKLQNRHLPLNSFDRSNRDYASVAMPAPKTCGNNVENLTNEDTRFTHPIINYREMYTASYNFTPYLHMNPQNVMVENTQYMGPERNGVSSRYNSKIERYSKNGAKVVGAGTPDFAEIHRGLLPKKGKVVPAFDNTNLA